MHHFTTAHTNESTMTAKWVVAMLMAIASLLVLMSVPQVAKAAVANPAFPRLAVWWPDNATQSAADRARCDWIALQDYDSSHIAELRAANPNIIVLGSASGREANYVLNDYSYFRNVELRSASTDWILTQVGSKLTANITTSTTSIPVADITKFAVGEMALVDHELVHIDSINGSVLTVTARGPVNPPAAHTAGTRIASVVSNWPGSITFDMSTNCPKRDVGHGLETFNDWNIRRGVSILNSANWDGLLIDCLEGNPGWMVLPGKNRSIDPLRTNTPVTDNYAAFTTAWNTGAVAYCDGLRASAGNKILIGNGNLKNYAFNGTIYEEFPYANLPLAWWNNVFVGPWEFPKASYPEWTANATAPNLTLIQTYGGHTDYKMMRYGLTSALMSDGYFSYALSSSGHAKNGLDWFDEYDNVGAGRGYLGQPTGRMTKAGNAWRRDFDGGIALVNPTDSAVTVQLGGSFTKIKGAQAPTVNDGTTVTSVTIPSRDGIILLRPVVAPPVDTTAPVTTSDAKTTYVSSAVVKLAATDNVGVTATYFTLDGGMQTAGTTINVTAAGAHMIQFWSVDAAGNVEVKKSSTLAVTIPDTTAPVTTSDAKTTYVSSAVVKLAATDNVGVTATYFTLDGGVETAGTTINVTAAGSHTIQFWSVDAAGNVEVKHSATFTITIPDTTAPVTTSDAKTTYVSSAVVKLAATDNLGVTYAYFTIDGGAQTSGTTINVTAAGSHTIQFWSVDAAGNVEVKHSATFTIIVPVPTGTMAVAGGVAQVTSPDVALASSVNGAADMRIDPGTGTFGSWVAYAANTQITLADGNGPNLVRAEYRNAGGTLQLLATVDLEQVVTPVDPPVVPVDPPVIPPVDPPIVPTETVVPAATLNTSAATLGYGHTATLQISATPAASMQVRVERQAGTSRWASVTTLTTDASGNAQFSVTPLVATNYRLVIVSAGAVSNTVSIAVSPRVTIHSSRRIVHKASTITLSGTASNSSGSTLLLQRSVNGVWKTVRSIAKNSAGRYAARVGFAKRGSYIYRIAVRTRANHLSVASATLRIRVN